MVTNHRRHHLQLRGSPAVPFCLFPSTCHRFIIAGELGNELGDAHCRLPYFPLSTSGPTGWIKFVLMMTVKVSESLACGTSSVNNQDFNLN